MNEPSNDRRPSRLDFRPGLRALSLGCYYLSWIGVGGITGAALAGAALICLLLLISAIGELILIGSSVGFCLGIYAGVLMAKKAQRSMAPHWIWIIFGGATLIVSGYYIQHFSWAAELARRLDPDGLFPGVLETLCADAFIVLGVLSLCMLGIGISGVLLAYLEPLSGTESLEVSGESKP